MGAQDGSRTRPAVAAPDAAGDERWLITGAQVLRGPAWAQLPLALAGGQVVDAPARGARRIDGRGCRLLPGIIDLHGDAFEREWQPRAAVDCPLPVAIAAAEAQLLAHGITTYCWSITDSFEPGLRSRARARALLDGIEAARPGLCLDHRIHIRHERAQVEHHDEMLAWLAAGRIDLLSLNDHLPAAGASEDRYVKSLSRRAELAPAALAEFLHSVRGRGEAGWMQVQELAAAARAHGVPLASHDDADERDLARSLALGAAIAEFPATATLAGRCRDAGMAVLWGAPNLVRGASHVGAVSVREAIAAGDAPADHHHVVLAGFAAVAVVLLVDAVELDELLVVGRKLVRARRNRRGNVPGERRNRLLDHLVMSRFRLRLSLNHKCFTQISNNTLVSWRIAVNALPGPRRLEKSSRGSF